MKKQKLKLLFFALFLIGAKNIISMDSQAPIFPESNPEATQKSESSDNIERFECSICFEEKDEREFYQLSCNHRVCFTCLNNMVETDQENLRKCPYCRKAISEGSIIDIKHKRQKIRHIKLSKTLIAEFLIVAAMIGYGCYRFFKGNKPAIKTINEDIDKKH